MLRTTKNAAGYPILLFLGFACVFQSCKDDEGGEPAQSFESGIFITNEGPFQNGSGTVYFYDRKSEQTRENIFEAANGGEQLGNIVQSIYIHDNKAYIVVNNAGKVVVADTDDFTKVTEILGLSLPRYFLPVSNDKAFITQWGSDGLSGSVAVVDLQHYQILKTIPTGAGAEALLKIGNEVFVANAGGFGRDSTIAVINIATETVSQKIVTGDNPNSLSVDKSGSIWTSCLGYTDFTDPSNNTSGRLVKIENKTVTLSLTSHLACSKLTINAEGDRLFYLDNGYGGNVFSFSTDATELETEPFIEGTYYSLGFDSVDKTILVSDAKDFASNGEVKMFSTDGVLLKTISAGVIPGGFWAF